MSIWTFLFERELAALAREGRALSFWWRDDDAREPTSQLDRLLALAERHDIPLTLAVIPTSSGQSLADRIRSARNVTIIQHGVDHVNRASVTDGGTSEMAARWGAQEIAARLEATREFRNMPNTIPVFAPPWNAVHPCLETALNLTGFAGWSAFGKTISRGQGLVRVDTHVDLLSWNDEVRFRGELRIMIRLIRLCRARRQARQLSEPIGLLTHHLQHDEASWNFLDRFFVLTKANAGAKWCALADIMQHPVQH